MPLLAAQVAATPGGVALVSEMEGPDLRELTYAS
jgi:hypothetical protein